MQINNWKITVAANYGHFHSLFSDIRGFMQLCIKICNQNEVRKALSLSLLG